MADRSPTTVFADSAETLGPVSADQATELARIFASAPGTPLHYLGPVTTPDQWTLQLRGHLPMHRVALDDGAGTEIYVSGKTGEVVMRTTRWGRALAYAGPVAHWLYLPVLRRNGPLWLQVVIWSSIAGCLLCVSGLIAGLIRFAPFRPLVVQRQRTMTPYRGWMKWHHYAGLVFGVVTTTWTFSGLLSMGPFPLLSSEGPTRGQRDAVTGSPSSIAAITVDQVHASLEIAGRDVAAREMRLVRFRGGLYWSVAASPTRHVLISAANPQQGVFPQFPKGELEAVAREMAPPNTSVDLQWLDEYDEYYYDRSGTARLPVLRARYDDPENTWIYLDPERGAIAAFFQKPDRVNRWLYNGLHSLDPAWLRTRRPLWDIVVIVLSLGGIAGAFTSVLPAWQRLRRHAQRLWRSRRGLESPQGFSTRAES